MHSHLILIVLSIFGLFLHVQCADNTTVIAVIVQNTTVVQNVTVPVTTVEYTTVITTEIPVNDTMATPALSKTIGSPYVEPPEHPLGYCIRSRIMCSKIRRCCKGPCNVNNMRCP